MIISIKFSPAHITLKISASDLGNTITTLEILGEEAIILLPNLTKPLQIISPDEVIGQYTELTIVAKAHFSKVAEIRPLNLVQERLTEAEIALTA